MAEKTRSFQHNIRVMTALYFLAVIFTTSLYAQSTYTLSLKKESIDPGSLQFNILKVVDQREIKSTIGIVQRGIHNKLRVSDFKQPVEEEIMDLIKRSSQAPTQLDMVMSIHHLEVREVLEVRMEGAVADLVADFFLVLSDSLYYITRQHATHRSKSIDVTHQHAANIAAAVEKVLKDFNDYDLENHVIRMPAISWDELPAYRPDPPAPSFAILDAHDFPDGIYATVEEFRNNQPSVLDGYEVEEGKNLSVNWTDGSVEKGLFPYYALAHNNGLYIRFEQEFYLIEKRSNTLIFFGPGRSSPGQNTRAWYLGGLAGLALASAGTNVRMTYEIDLNTGAFREITFTK